MEQFDNPQNVFLRYSLDNKASIDLLDFTKSLQALQSECSTFAERNGLASAKARLNIQKVEEGCIIIEIISGAISSALGMISSFNVIAEFWEYLGKIVNALKSGQPVPSDANNHKSLDNVSTFIQPLASNPESAMTVQIQGILNGDIHIGSCFEMNSSGGKRCANRVNKAKSDIDSEVVKTEDPKTHVLLRLARLDREHESKYDRGIIEAFDPKAVKKLLIDEEVKSWFMSSDENVFKNLHYVDVTVPYQEWRVKAYRITKVYENSSR